MNHEVVDETQPGPIDDTSPPQVVDETQPGPIDDTSPPQVVDITEIVKNSPILSRLIDEVRIERALGFESYNRMHNRHNRSR